MINNDWDSALKEEFEKEYFQKTMAFVEEEYKNKTIYPPYEDIFNAFKLTPLSSVFERKSEWQAVHWCTAAARAYLEFTCCKP